MLTGQGVKIQDFADIIMTIFPHLAYAEDVERGCVERPDEEVLWAERLDDDGLPRPRQVGHRVVAPHRVAEAARAPVHPGVHAVEIPGERRAGFKIKRKPKYKMQLQ